MENSKWRTGFDIATILALASLSFNAGIEYNKIDVVAGNQRNMQLNDQRRRENTELLSERVARMEAILQDIRDELRQANEGQRK